MSHRSHLYRKHAIEQQIERQNDVTHSDGWDFLTECDESSSELPARYVDPEAQRQRRAALFILKTKEERRLTQNSLDGLLSDITGSYLSSTHVA